jgi:hypothetical protein
MSCPEAAELLKQIDYARAELRKVRSPDSPSAKLSKPDKLALEKRARQELRLASRALKEHHFVCEACDKED